MAKQLKLKDRQALKHWNTLKKSILNATAVDYTEPQVDKLKRIAKLEADPEQWFAYYFPHYVKSPPADFHKKATQRILSNKRWYEIRAWSRELAKTTRAFFECMYLALTGDIKNMLLISNSYDNAVRLLMPFMIEFENNKRIENDYGEQRKLGHWEVGEFTAQCGCSFRALGAGQSPRGTRNEAARPDFILIDDIDTDEECRNPERIARKWDWIEQAVIPTVSVSGSYRILFNGNIIARDCCITRAGNKAIQLATSTQSDVKGKTKRQLGCFDIINIRGKDGLSTWKEKNSEQDIDDILSKISSASAQKEYFNNPISEGDTFKELTWGKVPPLHKFPFLINYSDPSPSNNTKAKANSYKSTFLLGLYEGKLYVITGYLDRVTNADFVDWFYFIDTYVGERNQVYNYIENNTLQNPFYEQVFIPLFAQAREKYNKIININEDTRKKPDKFARIEGNLEPLNRMGNLILNEDEKGNPHMQRLEEQFKMISPRLPAPADGVDCIEGGFFVANQKLSTLGTDAITFGTRTTNNKRF